MRTAAVGTFISAVTTVAASYLAATTTQLGSGICYVWEIMAITLTIASAYFWGTEEARNE